MFGKEMSNGCILDCFGRHGEGRWDHCCIGMFAKVMTLVS
jgi:hypothetical protein